MPNEFIKKLIVDIGFSSHTSLALLNKSLYVVISVVSIFDFMMAQSISITFKSGELAGHFTLQPFSIVVFD